MFRKLWAISMIAAVAGINPGMAATYQQEDEGDLIKVELSFCYTPVAAAGLYWYGVSSGPEWAQTYYSVEYGCGQAEFSVPRHIMDGCRPRFSYNCDDVTFTLNGQTIWVVIWPE